MLVELDPLTEFFQAIRNQNTKRNYEKDLAAFFNYLEIKGSLKEQASEFCKKAKQDPHWTTYRINEYIQFQKQRAERKEISESRIKNLYQPVKLFLEENDVVLNWKKLARRIPPRARAANDRAPSVEEIKTILSYPDRRIKPAVLVMESSGCRLGSFDYLNYGHISENGRIRIYAGTPEEYFSFITPECQHAIQEYIDFRKAQGEKITKDSPVIRDLFHPDRLGKGEPHLPVRLKSTGVKRMIEDALKATGLRTSLEKGKKRHEFQADHGFRKFFKTVCERKMKSLHVEMLLGHTVGLGDNYYRPDEKELLEEYQKAIPDLTLLEPRPQVIMSEDVESLKKRIAELEEWKTSVSAAIEEMHELSEKTAKRRKG
ncbi:MAG: hypothetical protein ACREBS_10210 [Nitrososphaerales archaeon]